MPYTPISTTNAGGNATEAFQLMPRNAGSIVLTIVVVLGIGFIWLLFEKPHLALSIAEMVFRGIARIALLIGKALWGIVSWIAGLFK